MLDAAHFPYLEEQFISAVEKNDCEKLTDLLAKDVNLNCLPPGQMNALSLAASLGYYDAMKLLIDNGVNLNIVHKDVTPILALCRSSCKNEDSLLSGLELLLSKGVDVNSCDSNGVSALSYAVKLNYEKLVIRLINGGAEIDKPDRRGWSPIFYAVASSNVYLFTLLRDYGAQMCRIDRRCRSLIDIAVECENNEIIKLLTSGLDTDKRCSHTNNKANGSNVYNNVIMELPSRQDRLSGFFKELENILNAVQLSHLKNEFIYNKLGLGHLLTANDDFLKKIGICFWFERCKIIHAVQKYHLHAWSTSSFDVVSPYQELDVYAAFFMATLTRQLYLISVSTHWWGKLGGIGSQQEKIPVIQQFSKFVQTLRKKIILLQTVSKSMNENQNYKTSDLILPSKPANKLSLKSFLFALVLGGPIILKFGLPKSYFFCKY